MLYRLWQGMIFRDIMQIRTLPVMLLLERMVNCRWMIITWLIRHTLRRIPHCMQNGRQRRIMLYITVAGMVMGQRILQYMTVIILSRHWLRRIVMHPLRAPRLVGGLLRRQMTPYNQVIISILGTIPLIRHLRQFGRMMNTH